MRHALQALWAIIERELMKFARQYGRLASALVRTGRKPKEARALAEEVVGGIQGALVLARALDSTEVFSETLKRFEKRLLS